MKHVNSVTTLRDKLRATLGALALICLTQLATTAQAAALKVGDLFPKLADFQLEGSLPQDLKGKIVLVDFWASWCGPCKESFPVMEELHSKFGGQGLVVLGVNVDDKKGEMEGFLKEHKASFTIVRDAKKKLVARTSIPSMPTSFILDGEGKIASIHAGFRGAETRKKYLQEIEELIKKNASK